MPFGLARAAACALSVALAAVTAPAEAQTPAARHARGTFEVQIKPAANDAGVDGTPLGRMTLDKQFSGDLAAASKGEMLTAGTPVKGSAVYVAIERVTGTLHGRRGSFVLHHRGVMTRGAPSLAVAIVPDSGAGELAGIAGTMTIDLSGGGHAYVLEYTLPNGPR